MAIEDGQRPAFRQVRNQFNVIDRSATVTFVNQRGEKSADVDGFQDLVAELGEVQKSMGKTSDLLKDLKTLMDRGNKSDAANATKLADTLKELMEAMKASDSDLMKEVQNVTDTVSSTGAEDQIARQAQNASFRQMYAILQTIAATNTGSINESQLARKMLNAKLGGMSNQFKSWFNKFFQGPFFKTGPRAPLGAAAAVGSAGFADTVVKAMSLGSAGPIREIRELLELQQKGQLSTAEAAGRFNLLAHDVGSLHGGTNSPFRALGYQIDVLKNRFVGLSAVLSRMTKNYGDYKEMAQAGLAPQMGGAIPGADVLITLVPTLVSQIQGTSSNMVTSFIALRNSIQNDLMPGLMYTGGSLAQYGEALNTGREALQRNSDIMSRLNFQDQNLLLNQSVDALRTMGIRASLTDDVTIRYARMQYDTLANIAANTGISVRELMKINQKNAKSLAELVAINVITAEEEQRLQPILDRLQATAGPEAVATMLRTIAARGGVPEYAAQNGQDEAGRYLLSGRANVYQGLLSDALNNPVQNDTDALNTVRNRLQGFRANNFGNVVTNTQMLGGDRAEIAGMTRANQLGPAGQTPNENNSFNALANKLDQLLNNGGWAGVIADVGKLVLGLGGVTAAIVAHGVILFTNTRALWGLTAALARGGLGGGGIGGAGGGKPGKPGGMRRVARGVGRAGLIASLLGLGYLGISAAQGEEMPGAAPVSGGGKPEEQPGMFSRIARSLLPYVGGAVGSIAGGVAGQALIPIPVVGALIGSMAGGYLGDMLTNMVTSSAAETKPEAESDAQDESTSAIERLINSISGSNQLTEVMIGVGAGLIDLKNVVETNAKNAFELSNRFGQMLGYFSAPEGLQGTSLMELNQTIKDLANKMTSTSADDNPLVAVMNMLNTTVDTLSRVTLNDLMNRIGELLGYYSGPDNVGRSANLNDLNTSIGTLSTMQAVLGTSLGTIASAIENLRPVSPDSNSNVVSGAATFQQMEILIQHHETIIGRMDRDYEVLSKMMSQMDYDTLLAEGRNALLVKISEQMDGTTTQGNTDDAPLWSDPPAVKN